MSNQTLFASQLRYWRKARGMSQVHLAACAGSTPRYISFLENGRSRPSEQMVKRLADALDVPLREKNELLEAAGFGRPHPGMSLGEAPMKPYTDTLKHILRAHDPYPAFVVNRWWDLVDMNDGMRRFFSLLEPFRTPRNMIEWFFDPDSAARGRFESWHEAAHAFLRRVRHDAMTAPIDQRLQQLVSMAERELRDKPPASESQDDELVICPAVRFDGTLVRSVGMTARFGAARDVTLDELRIECLFPRDEQSERFFRSLAEPAALRLVATSD